MQHQDDHKRYKQMMTYHQLLLKRVLYAYYMSMFFSATWSGREGSEGNYLISEKKLEESGAMR